MALETQVLDIAEKAQGSRRKAAGLLLGEVLFFLVMVAVAAYAGRSFVVSLSRALVEGLTSSFLP
jgi:hypothetical protein